ncbi:class I SAM-dependent DNA methyltransferase [Nonomuraea sp. NPDC049695]|uniref:class I SAM-dependent DNA methyltransferase n=1 Tax=Nonomuraea sp. NPDC049695 TaxID=3154734 RepID=UPI003418E5CB
MRSTASELAEKLWESFGALRNDGVSALEYLDQLTYLMFLKRGYELANDELVPDLALQPLSDAWQSLLAADGQELKEAYDQILRAFASREDYFGGIFRSAYNSIQDPDKLKKLIVDVVGLNSGQSGSVAPVGKVYESLLARAVDDDRSGLGQYYTPQVVVQALVACVQPGPEDTIYDPACGTGSLLLAARNYVLRHHSKDMTAGQRTRLDSSQIFGTELVPGASLLAKMNLILHGVDSENIDWLIEDRDSLHKILSLNPSIILANPPFGRRPRTNFSPGFWVLSRNKELNFLQYIASTLRTPGKAAVIVSDSLLFAGGAAAHEVRRKMLTDFNVHTLLRLPSGIFHSTAVKANVLFFDKKEKRLDAPQTSVLWVYDFRTDKHFSYTRRNLAPEDLDDFVTCYRPGKSFASRVETERFKSFSYEELMDRDQVNLDITWMKDSSWKEGNNASASDLIARAIVEDLTVARDEFSAIADLLEQSRARRSQE